jgi:hypothetical protein
MVIWGLETSYPCISATMDSLEAESRKLSPDEAFISPRLVSLGR